jgi:hypothetical protein
MSGTKKVSAVNGLVSNTCIPPDRCYAVVDAKYGVVGLFWSKEAARRSCETGDSLISGYCGNVEELIIAGENPLRQRVTTLEDVLWLSLTLKKRLGCQWQDTLTGELWTKRVQELVDG